MFTNRPAMQKGPATNVQQDQTKFSEHEKDFIRIRDAVQEKLLTDSNNESTLDLKNIRTMINTCFNEVLEEEKILYNHSTRNQMLEWITADIVGYGPIEPLLNDPDITEIMVNGCDQIYVERRGLIELTTVKFENNSHLMRIIDRIVSPIGRRVDESSPMVDARLPVGYRINATIHPCHWLGRFSPSGNLPLYPLLSRI